MRRLLCVVAALAAAAAASVASATADRVTDSTSQPFRVRLERSECFGTCPAYSVTVYGDGRVVFVGRRHVDAVGTRRARISRVRVRTLIRSVRRTEVFALKDRYDHMFVTDMPSATLAVRLGRRTKRIYHYHGDTSAPRKLSALECLVDRTARTRRWIGRPASATGCS